MKVGIEELGVTGYGTGSTGLMLLVNFRANLQQRNKRGACRELSDSTPPLVCLSLHIYEVQYSSVASDDNTAHSTKVYLQGFDSPVQRFFLRQRLERYLVINSPEAECFRHYSFTFALPTTQPSLQHITIK